MARDVLKNTRSLSALTADERAAAAQFLDSRDATTLASSGEFNHLYIHDEERDEPTAEAFLTELEQDADYVERRRKRDEVLASQQEAFEWLAHSGSHRMPQQQN